MPKLFPERVPYVKGFPDLGMPIEFSEQLLTTACRISFPGYHLSNNGEQTFLNLSKPVRGCDLDFHLTFTKMSQYTPTFLPVVHFALRDDAQGANLNEVLYWYYILKGPFMDLRSQPQIAKGKLYWKFDGLQGRGAQNPANIEAKAGRCGIVYGTFAADTLNRLLTSLSEDTQINIEKRDHNAVHFVLQKTLGQ